MEREQTDGGAKKPAGKEEKSGNGSIPKMPVYDKEEPWVKKYMEESGEEPGFF